MKIVCFLAFIVMTLIFGELLAFARDKCEGDQSEIIYDIADRSSSLFSRKFIQDVTNLTDVLSSVTPAVVSTVAPLNKDPRVAFGVILASPLINILSKLYQTTDKDDLELIKKFLLKNTTVLNLSPLQLRQLCKAIEPLQDYKNFVVRTSYLDDQLESAKNWGRYCLPKRCQFLAYGATDEKDSPNGEKLSFDLAIENKNVIYAFLAIDAVLNDLNPDKKQAPYNNSFCAKIRVNGGPLFQVDNLGLEHGIPYDPQPPKGYKNFRNSSLVFPPESLIYFQSGNNQIRFQLSCANGYVVVKSSNLIVLAAERRK